MELALQFYKLIQFGSTQGERGNVISISGLSECTTWSGTIWMGFSAVPYMISHWGVLQKYAWPLELSQ
jgi:hypothetical protein